MQDASAGADAAPAIDAGPCPPGSNGVVCRPAAGPCDEAEVCADGVCPRDAIGAATANRECRAASDVCDTAERCDGASVACPSDQKKTAGTECRAGGGVCDTAESCDGVASACPADAFQPNTVVCRESADLCDANEMCTGSSATCPADGVSPATQACGAYLCGGASMACPSSCTSDAQCSADSFCSTNSTCARGKIAFTTSTSTKGNLGGLAGADAICQARAAAAGRTGTFKAWLSDSTTSAAARLTHASVPYAYPNGTRMADNWADLTDGTIASPFRITEFGVEVPGNLPFTATEATGAAIPPDFCSNWTSTAGTAAVGQSDATGSFWSYGSIRSNDCNVLHRLYCF